MKILVAGGAGFLGSHLIEKLLHEGHFVYCLDNLSSGRIDNLEGFNSSQSLEFIEADVAQVPKIKVDQIYNLASPASPEHYQRDAIGTLKTNILGSLALLELAAETGARILQASTSEVYGDPLVHPQVEAYWGNVNPIGIRSCYDEGKRAAESLFFNFQRQRHVDIRVIRIFNTYGPRMLINDGRVVSNFIVQALKNSDITIYGTGKQTRSFCYVSDLIAGMMSYMNLAHDYVGPMNLGNPVEYTILQLATQIIELTKSSSSITFKEFPADDPTRRRPNIDLAEGLIGWHPQIPINVGLQQTINYFKIVLQSNTSGI